MFHRKGPFHSQIRSKCESTAASQRREANLQRTLESAGGKQFINRRRTSRQLKTQIICTVHSCHLQLQLLTPICFIHQVVISKVMVRSKLRSSLIRHEISTLHRTTAPSMKQAFHTNTSIQLLNIQAPCLEGRVLFGNQAKNAQSNLK